MQRILNARTKTVHKPRTDTNSRTTACGALAHVPDTRVRVVSGEELETTFDIDRCGRCFEEGGGY